MGSNYTVSRRGFLGAALVALPGVRALSALGRMREAEYVLSCTGFEPVKIVSLVNGSLSASWMRRAIDVRAEDRRGSRWWIVSGEIGEHICQLRVSRPGPKTLDIDYIALMSPELRYFDDYLMGPNQIYGVGTRRLEGTV